jgi:hypothetical protein
MHLLEIIAVAWFIAICLVMALLTGVKSWVQGR